MKAVFPVNGLGTRFLPATKAMPKEMLPVVDKPLIQYAVEEAVAAGITEMIFVTGRTKRAIEDHFDNRPELERELEEKGKKELLETLRSIVPAGVTCVYIRQPQPLGLGHAVLCARPVVGNEPFAVILADDLVDADVSVTKQLMEARERAGAAMSWPCSRSRANTPSATASYPRLRRMMSAGSTCRASLRSRIQLLHPRPKP